MERKKMHKRKGQWVTISTSLVASMMLGASSQTLVYAQETSEVLIESSAATDEAMVTEDVVEASMEAPVVEETLAIEAPITAEVPEAPVVETPEVPEVEVENLVEVEMPEATEEYTEVFEDNGVIEEESVVVEEAEVIEEEVVDSEAPEVVEEDAAISEEAEAVEEDTAVSEETEVVEEDVVDSEAPEAVEEDTAISEEAEAVEEDTADSEAPEVVEEDAAISEEAEAVEEDTAVSEETEVVEEDVVDSEAPEVVEEDSAISEEAGVIEEESELSENPEIPEEPEISEENEESEEEAETPENPEDSEEGPETPEDPEISEEDSEEEEGTEEVVIPEDSETSEEPVESESDENPETETEPDSPALSEANPSEELPESNTNSETPTQSTPIVASTNSSMNQTHSVNQGDTLWSLARKFNVSVAELKEWNSLSSDLIITNASLIVSNPNNATNSSDEKRQQDVANQGNNSQTVGSTNNNSNQTSASHTINKGDTLWSIAQRNNVTVADLIKWNNLSSTVIHIDGQLIVSNPTSDNTQKETEAGNDSSSSKQPSYTINQGDTLWSIAQKNNVTVSQLQEWNNLSSYLIHANQQLVVNNPNGNQNTGGTAEADDDTSSETQQTHTVNRGEYLYSIAKQYGVSVSDLASWNNLTANSVIHPNDRLIVTNPNGSSENAKPNENTNENSDENTVESAGIQAMINWFKEREGNVTYSMSDRLGPDSYDCSSAVFFALMAGGYIAEGTWPGTTESLFALEGTLLTAISRDEVQEGDIFVAGVKGNSLGAGGHTGVALSNSSIIHANYSDNGISTTPIEGYTSYAGIPTYWYRLTN
ncbi:LysM peptidoglycan-binding domain-containing protein [Aerococcaceae bacterium WS4759]|uniref:LysM peptidoglycan-binding domain-containing protein n=1 Tax=Fundicoccus ignavus TaxID=2664442 RepID=A0A6I2GDM1_9LACT|nr:LysM peptidoglycan-binding domain-containing protein [Fundicoccus ignavus]MRI85907.1 LysM peptidoglycan-binding domain-containing protein [Fundicoccus ignavus]